MLRPKKRKVKGVKKVKNSRSKSAGACRPSSKNCGYKAKNKSPKRGSKMPKRRK